MISQVTQENTPIGGNAIILNKEIYGTFRAHSAPFAGRLYTTTTCVALKAVFVGRLAFVCTHHKESLAVLAGARYVMTFYT